MTSPAKGASTLLLLRARGPQSVTQIAQRLRLSHPMIINVTRELEGLDLVVSREDPFDRRRRPVSLTTAGEIQADRIAAVNRMMAAAYGGLFLDAGVRPLSPRSSGSNGRCASGLSPSAWTKSRSPGCEPRPPFRSDEHRSLRN